MPESIDPALVPKRRLYTGAEIPGVGLGTFGSDKYGPEEISHAVYGAIRGGYRLIDCASVYGNEGDIGEILSRIFYETQIRREDLFIQSKVWNDMHREVERSCEKSLKDLKLDYLDMFFVHWPFPNYHSPGCGPDYRNPDSRPFSIDEFMDTWGQCEKLVKRGLTRHIGMSNMTIPKLDAVLPLVDIQPAALELECHPGFQQPELFNYAVDHDIQPIGFCPLGSPSRPERDRTAEDVADIAMPEIVEIAKDHGVHPAIICLKWAVQRGQIPIPFSVKEPQYLSNLRCATEDPLSDHEMEIIKEADKNCRLVKGQVFLWEGAKGWEDLWDLDGTITR